MTRRPAAGPALLLLALVAWMAASTAASTAAFAAVVEERWQIEIRSADEVVERRSLTVEIEDADDVEAWRRVPVLVDENRRLERVEGFVVAPDGDRDTIGRRDRDESQLTVAGMMHMSPRIVWLEPDDLVAGSRLEIDIEVVEDPYFPSDQLRLGSDDDVVTLEVVVRAAPGVENWRWRLDGDTSGLVVREEERGVVVTGVLDGTGPDEPDLAVSRRPRLRWAWHRGDQWAQVARWYTDVVRALPRDDAAVRALAAELTAPDRPPRQRLEDLVAFVRDQVRYVAVAVGVGGYRPSPPHETLERRWGDCKDKSFLLLDLLNAAGIEALPVLARLDDTMPVDPAWPDALQFNHLIVAVPVDGAPSGTQASGAEPSGAESIETTPDDPVADGLLFIDPTQTVGGADYLHGILHGSHGLVVRPGGGELVRLPVRPRLDEERLEVELTIDAEGDASGRATIHLRGDSAVPWLVRGRNKPRAEVDDAVRGLFQAHLPGYRLGELGWRAVDPSDPSSEGEIAEASDGEAEGGSSGVPEATLQVLIEGAVGGAGAGGGGEGAGSLSLPAGVRLTPATRALDEVIALGDDARAAWSVRSVETVLRLHMPAGACPPRPRDDAAGSAAGSWRQSITSSITSEDTDDGLVVTVRRGGVVDDPWPTGAALTDLRAMAVAEQRAQRRRLRPVCP